MHQPDVVLPASKNKIVRNTPRWLRFVFRGYALLITACISVMYMIALSALAAQLNEPTIMRSLVVGTITFIFYTITFFISLLFAYGFYKQRSFIIWPSIILGLDAALVMYQTLAWYQSMISDFVLQAVIITSAIYILLGIIVVMKRHYFVPQRLGVTFSVILSLAFIPPMVIAISALTTEDLPSVVDNALVVPDTYEQLSEYDNAYYSLPDLDAFPRQQRQQIVDALRVYDKYINEENIDDAELFNAIDETKFVTDAFLVAAKKRGYQCPEALNLYGYDARLCSLGKLREYAYVTELRSYAAQRSGDVAEAVVILESLIRFAHMLESTPPTPLVQYLVSSSLALHSYQAANRFLDATEDSEAEDVLLARSELREVLLQNKPDKDKNLVDSLRYTYTDTKNSIGGDLGSAKTNYLWHPNRTMQTFADVWLLTVRFTETPCGEGEELRSDLTEKVKLQQKQSSSLTRLLFRPNVIGNNIASMLLTPLTPMKDKACELEAQHTQLLNRLGD